MARVSITCGSHSPESFARILYAEGFKEDESFRRTYATLGSLLRSRKQLDSRPARQSEAAHQLQLAAVELALENAYRLACDKYYQDARKYRLPIPQPEAPGYVWYMLNSGFSWKGGSSSRHLLAKAYVLVVESDNQIIRVGVDANGIITANRADWVDEYAGPAGGLMHWARSHAVLLHREDMRNGRVRGLTLH